MNIKRYIHNLFHHRSDSATREREIIRLTKEASSKMSALLRQQAINFYNQAFLEGNYGLTEDKLCESEVIISLTTFGSRIEKVYLTIESIMQGVVKPNRIILWLAKDDFCMETIPATLLKQKERGLQIEFCEDIRSYKKLIPTLKKYPEACIVTIDDDVMYDIDFLDKLLRTHKQHPKNVLVNVARQIVVENGKVQSYIHWPHVANEAKIETPYIIGIGVGGILYPAHSLHEEVLNQEAFMKLCPYGDDIWFYAMAIKNHTQTMKSPTNHVDGDFVDIYDESLETLSIQNTSAEDNRNDKQFKAVFDKYQLWEMLKYDK